MSNHPISNGKTVYDIFNMINPNCYQAFIIMYVIENKKEEAIRCCDELRTAIEYYKWDSSGTQSSYIDALICDSNLEKWQKIAIIHIIANNIDACKKTILNEIESEKEASVKRIESAKQYNQSPKNQIESLYRLFGFDSFL